PAEKTLELLAKAFVENGGVRHNKSSGIIRSMRYLVRARVKPGREAALLKAIDDGKLGEGSVAEGEYLRNMGDARLCEDRTARWVEVCYCPSPLREERPY